MPAANLGLRFLLELFGIAAFAYVGSQISVSAAVKAPATVAAAAVVLVNGALVLLFGEDARHTLGRSFR